jgi:hypothetical protein
MPVGLTSKMKAKFENISVSKGTSVLVTDLNVRKVAFVKDKLISEFNLATRNQDLEEMRYSFSHS